MIELTIQKSCNWLMKLFLIKAMLYFCTSFEIVIIERKVIDSFPENESIKEKIITEFVVILFVVLVTNLVEKVTIIYELEYEKYRTEIHQN